MKITENDLRVVSTSSAFIQQQKTAQQALPQSPDKENSVKRDAAMSSEATQQVIDNVSIKIDLPRRTVDTIQRLGNLTDFINSVATNLRETSKGLEKVATAVTEMKKPLSVIIKNYPPFTMDSEERANLLMQYSSIKQEILKMTFPPPPPPIYEKVRHLWDDLFSGTDKTLQAPTLPVDAPDTHVVAAAKQLDVISGQLALLQEPVNNLMKVS